LSAFDIRFLVTPSEPGDFGYAAALGGEWLLWYNRGWIGEFFGNLVELSVPGEAAPSPSNVERPTSNVQR
jgi:hypothetical protein